MVGENTVLGFVLLAFGFFGILVVLWIAFKSQPDYQILSQIVTANKLASANKRNEYNQNMLTLHLALSELRDDVSDKEIPETEYQARSRHCRELANNTGEANAVGITNAIIDNLRQAQQAHKEADTSVSSSIIESVHYHHVNNELRLLLNKVQNE